MATYNPPESAEQRGSYDTGYRDGLSVAQQKLERRHRRSTGLRYLGVSLVAVGVLGTLGALITACALAMQTDSPAAAALWIAAVCTVACLTGAYLVGRHV